jgi:iron-sulfur cluster assembly protein
MEPNIHLTANAVSHINSMLHSSPQFPGIRLGVKASGCSGLSYVLDFIKEQREDDIELILEGIKVAIDKQSLRYLQGMEIDCVEEGLNKHLKFNNPNVKGECGCGESFTIGEE